MVLKVLKGILKKVQRVAEHCIPIFLCSELLSISYVAFKKLHVLSDKKNQEKFNLST